MRVVWLVKLSMLIALFGFFGSAHAGECTYVNGKVDVANIALDSNGKDRNCNFTPDGVKMKLYDLYLCEDLPTATNYRSACGSIFNNATGQDIELSKGKVSSLMNGDITLQEGSYSYAVLIIQNTVSLKFQSEFTYPIRGKSGVGTSCWTNGNDVKIFYHDNFPAFSAECGTAADANPQYSKYTYTGFWNPMFPSNPFKAFIDGIAVGGSLSAYLLSDLNTIATVTPGNDPFDADAVVTDAKYIMGIFKFPSVQTISPATTNIDMGIGVQNAAFMKVTTNSLYHDGGTPICNVDGTHGLLQPHPSTGAYSCLSTSYPNGLTFKFEVN